MSLHRLPDGRVINIKDNLGDQELIALQNHLAELYPGYYTPYIEEVERTFGGEVFNAVKQIPGGFINSFLNSKSLFMYLVAYSIAFTPLLG